MPETETAAMTPASEDARDDHRKLAEVVTRNREVTRLRLEWERKHAAAKAAKAALEEAQDDLNDYISGLNEKMPLFDQAPAEVNAASGPRPVVEVDRDDRLGDIKSPLGSMIYTPVEDASVPTPWRDRDLVNLPAEVSLATCNALRAIGISTLGQLDDEVKTLDDQERLAKRAGLKPKVAEKLFTILNRYIAHNEKAAVIETDVEPIPIPERLLDAMGLEDAPAADASGSDDQAGDYPPSHPWYYFQGGRVLDVDEIEPAETSEESAVAYATHFRSLPKDPSRRREKLSEGLAAAEEALARDIQKYTDLRERGEEAIDGLPGFGSFNCRPIDYAFSFKHNHVSYHKGMVRKLRAMLDAEPAPEAKPKKGKKAKAGAIETDAETILEAESDVDAAERAEEQAFADRVLHPPKPPKKGKKARAEAPAPDPDAGFDGGPGGQQTHHDPAAEAAARAEDPDPLPCVPLKVLGLPRHVDEALTDHALGTLQALGRELAAVPEDDRFAEKSGVTPFDARAVRLAVEAYRKGEPSVYLVSLGEGRNPVEAVRARSLREALDDAKLTHGPVARVRLDFNDHAARGGLAVRDVAAGARPAKTRPRARKEARA